MSNPKGTDEMTTTTVTATARVAGSKIVHTVTAVRDGQPVKVYAPTRRSVHRYGYAIVRHTNVGGERAVIVDRWTNTNRARADQARVPVAWEATGEWGDVAVGDVVSTRGRHGVGQPEITGRIVTRSADGGTVWIETPDGNRQRSISSVRRVSA